MKNLNLVIGYTSSDFRVTVKNFEIENGKINTILGTNGCGKSTLYKTLLGEICPIEGTVPESLQNEIAIVSDRVNVPDDCTVKSVLGLLDDQNLKNVFLTYPEISSFVKKQLNKKISNLSSGQKRVVQIFLMLASGKNVIVMDEACAYLDLKNKHLVFEAMKNVVKSGASVLYTSHELEDLDAFNSSIYMFDDGVLAKCSSELTKDTLKNKLLHSEF